MGNALRCQRCGCVVYQPSTIVSVIGAPILIAYRLLGPLFNAPWCRRCLGDLEEIERQRQEEARRQAEARRQEEIWRREEARRQAEARRQEEIWRREEIRRRQEEIRRRQDEARRQAEARRQEEIRRMQEEIRRQEEMRRQEEARRQEEIRRRQEEERRTQEGIGLKLEESHRRALKLQEAELSVVESEGSKHDVLKVTFNEFERKDKSDGDSDQFLRILSERCQVSPGGLCLSRLTPDDLLRILSVLKALLFEEWATAPPSLATLQHAQVFITELCTLSSPQSFSEHMQLMVESVSQSARSVSESFLLNRALYLTLEHFLFERSECGVVLMAKRWAAEELSSEEVVVIEFLSTLLSALQKSVETATVFVLRMEIQTLKLLLNTLPNLKEPSCRLLGLVQENRWTPVEAMDLLKVLSLKFSKEETLVKVLTLVQIHELPPGWTEGCPLLRLDSSLPDRCYEDFQRSLRLRDESSLSEALTELKNFWSLDGTAMDTIRSITTAVLRDSADDAPLLKDSFRGLNLDAEGLTESLRFLCRAVFLTKGWWPTVRMLLRWCVLVLTEHGAVADSCVIAMFAAAKALTGIKVDVLLSSDSHPGERAEEWSDFYSFLGLTVDTMAHRANAPSRDVYEANIVYGSISDFVSEYVQQGMEVIETGNTRPSRRVVFEGQTFPTDVELSKLKDRDVGVILQSLLGKIPRQDTELRQKFMKALFKVLHSNLNKDGSSDCRILHVYRRINVKELTTPEIFILTLLEKLLKEVSTETEANKASPAVRWCLEMLFKCVEQNKPSPTAEVLRMVSDLEAQRLWSATESLSLLTALTDHHYDNSCVHIMKILHLMLMYQVSSQWMDDKDQSFLTLVGRLKTEDLIEHLEKNLQNEKAKSIDALFEELRRIKDVDEQTLNKSYSVVTHVRNLIRTGEIKKHTHVQKARALSRSREPADLQQVLAVICNAVHATTGPSFKGESWWPRDSQMISWCLLALSDTGRLLEMGTGEGKSCVIAMFAALRVLQGEKVDVVSSSSVLCQRDAKDWEEFYWYFEMTADSNTNKAEDTERRRCYRKDVVYGTIEAFAADHLRQVFEMKNVRPGRGCQCVIIDEVDSLLLDQGVQLTYLSSPTVSMQHLNVILTMIWGHVNQFGFLSSGHRTFIRGPPASFFKSIFDSIDTEGSDITDPTDILKIAEETGTVEKGFSEQICHSKKDHLLRTLRTVSQDAMVDFFHRIEDYVPFGFTVYTLDTQGLLCLRKRSPYNDVDIPELTFLVLDEGLCCTLYDSEEDLIKPIADIILQKIQYTPCEDDHTKINVPGFLRELIEKKVSVWVQNAFLAKQLKEGQEYVIQNDSVCPVDFRSTGIVELNKKWVDGLQQFVEIKHQVKLSTVSMVTNYISNSSFLEMYRGKIYGTTGTLGGREDITFLQKLYPNLCVCKMPTFNRKKLFELKGTLTDSPASPLEWKSEIKRVVLDQVSPNSYRGGRAVLVICETINKAKEIHKELKDRIPGKSILYCRSDKDSLSRIDHELLPGDAIFATNLAGRGTDIKVSKKVNDNGGLFVILSFLAENTRVELQAFGRTARQGKPGSAQIILSAKDQLQSARMASSLEEAKDTRDRLTTEKTKQMMEDLKELRLREELFSDYCKTLHKIYATANGSEKKAVVSIMNEYWGIWLQMNSEEIDQLKRDDLKSNLESDLQLAKSRCQSQTSPCSSIYHYIKFGNLALNESRWEESSRLFKKAMEQDKSWAAIAFYSHAYCTIKQRKGDYFSKARDDLQKAQDSLKYLSEEVIVCLQMVKMSSPPNMEQTSLEKQLSGKQQMLFFLDKNITESIQMLDELKAEGLDAVVRKSPVFSLVVSDDAKFHEEATNLLRQGLQYVFSVEKEPCFPWDALLAFLTGAALIIVGALLTAHTFGICASIGTWLISEGISDCISAVMAMVGGDFSWKAWATKKAVSIGVSLAGLGIGKLLSKGFNASKTMLSKLGKELKGLPEFFSKQSKELTSVVAKTNMKNAVKFTAKKVAEKLVFYGIGKVEEEIIQQILNCIENEVRVGTVGKVRSKLRGDELGLLVDIIVLSHVPDEGQLQHLLQDGNRKMKLLSIFKELSNTAIRLIHTELSVHNKLHKTIQDTINTVENHSDSGAEEILTAIRVLHLGSLAVHSTTAALSFSENLFPKLKEQMRVFIEGNIPAREVRHPTPLETNMLTGLKQELADIISGLMASVLVKVFHQTFSCHLASCIQRKVHKDISKHVTSALETDRTSKLLQAGQHSNYIRNMALVPDSPSYGREERKLLTSHANKIRSQTTSGTIMDLRVLSETTGTRIVILTENSQGRLTRMQELNPTGPAGGKVTLIYRPKSDRYDVLIGNRTVGNGSKDKSCLFHALARGLNPDANEAEITKNANRLRCVEAKALLGNPDQWEPFIQRKKWIEEIQGGHWYLAKRSEPKSTDEKETSEALKRFIRELKSVKHAKENRASKEFLGAEPHPPAIRGVGTKASPLAPIEDVKDDHSSRDAHLKLHISKSLKSRELLATTVKDDDMISIFKLTTQSSMVGFRLESDEDFVSFNSLLSETRLSLFEQSLSQQRTTRIWSTSLRETEVTADTIRTRIKTITARAQTLDCCGEKVTSMGLRWT